MDSINENIKKGWIYKRSRFLHKWRKRYCVISQKLLSSFKGEDISEIPTEQIPLFQCSGVRSAEDNTGKLYSFEIDNQGELFYFHCESEKDKDQWIGAISKVILNRETRK